MKPVNTLVAVLFFFVAFNISMLPSVSGQKKSSIVDTCVQAKKNYFSSQQKWSEVNTVVRFLRDELEQLRELRWDAKTTLSVLEDALKIIKDSGSLSAAQRITLNSRIPNNLGMINPDDTFIMEVLDKAPVKIDDAKNKIERLLNWTEDDIKKTETGLTEKEKESHRLSRRLTELESQVEKSCKAAGDLTPWDEGVPRLSGEDIYWRFVQREMLRQEEVENRSYADIERYWLKKHYYSRHRRFPFSTGFRSRCMLIRFKNIDRKRSRLRCFPFRSSWDKRWILEELDKASHHHEHIPGVGRLGEYQVIEVLDDMTSCYEKLF
ncbi:MAG: hypothetical protein PVJ87_05580 [Desulfobacterales bacterium]|jgi:hypothetical protein